MLTRNQKNQLEQSNIVLNMILDISGSMATTKHLAISGYNTFINEQKKLGNCLFNLYLFNQNIQQIHTNLPLSDIPNMIMEDFNTNGTTALFDAIGLVLNGLNNTKKNIVVVITDGEENSSTKYSQEDIRKLVETTKDYCDLVFIGSNQDAILTGSNLNIRIGSSLTYNDQNIENAYLSLSNACTRTRSGLDDKVNFTMEERQQSLGAFNSLGY